MNVVFNPVLPMMWWFIIAFLAVMFVIGWGVAAIRSKSLNLNWVGSVVVIGALVGLTLNPGIEQVVETEIVATPEEDEVERIESDYNVFFVVDTTSSIAAEDWDGQPRLVGVREDIETIVEQFPNSRYAMITFDSEAIMRVPITSDSTAVISAARTLRQEITSGSSGSSVGTASAMLSEVMSANFDETKKAVVFFFSDGEQTSAQPREGYEAAGLFVDTGLVLGYGTEEGAPMRIRSGYSEEGEGNYIVGADGEVGISTIDEANLQQIAEELNVEYVKRNPGSPLNVAPGGDGSLIGEVSTNSVSVFGLYWVFALLVIVGMLLLLADFIVRAMRTRRAVL